MKITTLFLAGLLAGALLPACGADEATEGEITLEADELDLEAGDKSDSLAASSTYYTARRDMRRCVYPICGGFWVKRVNRATTRCADGRYAAECYVPELDLSAIGLNDQQDGVLVNSLEAGRALVRGRITTKVINEQSWGVLAATEGWLGQIEATPSGDFLRARDSGIRCVRAPCPSIHVSLLNYAAHINVTDLAGEAITEKVPDQLGNDGGVLLAGRIYQRGQQRIVRATQSYLRMIPQPEQVVSCAELSLEACASEPMCEVGPTGCDRPRCVDDGEGGRVCNPCDPYIGCRHKACTSDTDCPGGTTCQPLYVCVTTPCDAPSFCRR